MAARRRTVALAGLLAVLAAAGTALVSCAAPAPGWTGGEVSPAPVRVTVNPSALPIGDAVATGVVVGTREMVLFLWGDRDHPELGTAWRDTGTGEIDGNDPIGSAVPDPVLAATDPIFGLDQLVAGDGTVIELGAVRGPVARVTSTPPGRRPVEARFVRWSADPGVVIFWLRRAGPPIPPNRTVDNGTEPYGPERYPLICAYDRDGHPVASARIRPLPWVPRMDG
jgi:hypothetical protein